MRSPESTAVSQATRHYRIARLCADILAPFILNHSADSQDPYAWQRTTVAIEGTPRKDVVAFLLAFRGLTRKRFIEIKKPEPGSPTIFRPNIHRRHEIEKFIILYATPHTSNQVARHLYGTASHATAGVD